MYPYLSYRDAAAALRFFEEAFGFATGVRWDASAGTVQHAEATFGDGAVMMGTADHPSVPLVGASVGQGFYVYVEDVDAHFERARPGWCTRRRTPSGGRAAIGCSTRRGTSGASAATGPARRAARERSRNVEPRTCEVHAEPPDAASG
jgi:hypothetical protein